MTRLSCVLTPREDQALKDLTPGEDADRSSTEISPTRRSGPGFDRVQEDFPDAPTATGSGQLLLTYEGDDGASVGVASQAALVGFPLELVDDSADRAALVGALLDFVATP